VIDIRLRPATEADASAIARLHAESWQQTYSGMLPAEYLAQAVLGDRLRRWQTRLASPSSRTLTLTAVGATGLVGFVHVELDLEPDWGARLENIHVQPDLKGTGIGTRLFTAARDWIAGVEPTWRMHLWVLEQNAGARRFYEHRGGQAAERKTIEVIKDCWVPEVRYVWPPP